jgi:hypothetical protein
MPVPTDLADVAETVWAQCCYTEIIHGYYYLLGSGRFGKRLFHSR